MANANGAMPPELQGLPALSAFVRPEQIPGMGHLTDANKRAYIDGLNKIYLNVRNNPPNTPLYIQNYKRLNDITAAIKQQMIRSQQQSTSRPSSQGQSNLQENGQGQHTAGQNGNGQVNIPQAVLDKVRAMPISVPPHVSQQGQPAAASYVRNLKYRFAQNFAALEQYKGQLQSLDNAVEQKQRKGETLTAAEQANVNQRKQVLQTSVTKTREVLVGLQNHQNELKRQVQGQGTASIKEEGREPNSQVTMPSQQPTQSVTPANHTGQAHTVSSALDAVRNQQATGSATSPTKNVQQQNSRPPPNQAADASQLNRLQMPPSTQASSSNVAHSQPPPAQPQIQTSTASTSGPAPLPLNAAVDRSRELHTQSSYANNNASNPSAPPSSQQNQASGPGASSHAHPQVQSRNDTNSAQGHRMPIAREMKFEPPQPVSMGPARPTLTGGPSNMNLGSMGAPALSKHPGYVLGVEGERVLSKKKLQELVRQVTGGSGLDGDGEELDPQVEEVCLAFPPTLLHIRPAAQCMVFCFSM